MALTTAKLTLYNDKGEELTIEAMNTLDRCHPKDLGELIMSLAYQAGAATTAHPGFVDWGGTRYEKAFREEQ